MSAQLKSDAIQMDAPISGWDAFHSLDNMPPTAAVILNNLIPGAGTVDTRKGYYIYIDLGTAKPVETVASMNQQASSSLIAASDGGVWDITDRLVPVQLAATSTFSSSKWQTENFRKADEDGILVMCNGVDTTQIYDGAALTAIDTTGTAVGVLPDDVFLGSVTFKGRMYYWREDDNAFYYTQAGSYQGEFQKFDLGSFAQLGGKLLYIMTWTQQDSGDGRDDFLVFVFNTGEILVYQGDDPETTGYFEMVGRYFTGEPLSVRGHTNYGADAILMTKDGYVALSTIIQEGRTSDVPQFSRLIHRAITDRTRNGSHLYGWDVELYAREGLFVFNVPLSDQTFEQHVMNTVTQRWCRFKGLEVNCLEVHDEQLFGGDNMGNVYGLLEGTSDNGNPIDFDCLYAFQFLGVPGHYKHLTAAQVFTTHSRPEEIQLSGYADYQVPVLTPIPYPEALDAAIWSVNPPSPASPLGSYWDEEYWSTEGTQYTTKGWQNVSAYGYAVSLLVRFAKVNESVTWRSTNIRYHVAGAQ